MLQNYLILIIIFKSYYASVMGYFANGPFGMLKEARRVLKENGELIILILQVNPAKKIEDIINFRLMKKRYRQCSEIIDTNESILYTLVDDFKEALPPLPNFSFHEYAFTRKEAVNILQSSGFVVEHIQSAGIEQGLLRYKLFRDIRKAYLNIKGSSSKGELAKPSASLLKDMIVSDKTNIKIARPFLWLLKNTAANLLILACRKKINN